MSLSFHRVDHPSPAGPDWSEYTIVENGRPIGRIFQRRSVPELPWFWSITTVPSDQADKYMHGRAATMESAKADFEANYERWITSAPNVETKT